MPDIGQFINYAARASLGYWPDLAGPAERFSLPDSPGPEIYTGSANMQKNFELLWRNKFLTLEAKTGQEMVEQLEAAARKLREIWETKKVEYSHGADDDYATFTTTDPEIAEKYGFEPVAEEDEDNP